MLRGTLGINRRLWQQCARRLSLAPIRVPKGHSHHPTNHLTRLQIRPNSTWTPPPSESSSRFAWSRRTLLFIPLGGGILLYLNSRPRTAVVPALLASPGIIPCSEKRSSLQHHPISSPDESQRNILCRILVYLYERIIEPLLTTRRFIYLCYIFAPVLLASPMLFIGHPDPKLGGDRWGAVWWYGLLVSRMQRAGPTFIKLGQWAGSRADLFPDLLCDRLGRLHSNGHPHSLAHTKRVIKRAFNLSFDEVFEHFDETPIGVGAIAQVYRATLRHDLVPLPKRKAEKRRITGLISPTQPPEQDLPPRTAVAIKILHPRVEKTITRDLAIMSFFAHFLTLFPNMQWISLPEEVGTFGRMMMEQLDLRNESSNLKTFEANFAKRNGAVTFPKPLELWSSNDVLVEEYQNALPLKTFLKHGGGPFDDRIANLGLDAFLNMLLLDNFCHSDLHPGNIMVKFYKPTTKDIYQSILSSIFNTPPPPSLNIHSPSSEAESAEIVSHLQTLAHNPEAWRNELVLLDKKGYQPELVFLDAGLITTLNESNRRNFLDLFRAIAKFDGYTAGKLMVERCRSPELAIETETFALKMQHLCLTVKSKTFTLARIKISDVLTDVLLAVRRHHVKMEGDFINTIISILLLEGIGRQLDPNLDLFKSSLPILRQLGRQMSAKEAVAALPGGNIGAMLKMWVLIEARELASAASVNADSMIRYDWLTPNI